LKRSYLPLKGDNYIMGDQYGRHYHVEVNSKTIRLPVYIFKNRSEADRKYEELISEIKEETGGKIKFHGTSIASIGFDVPEHYISMRPCIQNCLLEME
jgi:hypothetical protein